MDRSLLLDSLSRNEDAIQALTHGAKEEFLQHLRRAHPCGPISDNRLYRTVLTWIGQRDKPCPPNVLEAQAKLQEQKKSLRISKRHFIHESGLSTAAPDRDAFLAGIPTISVAALSAPYPPYKEIIAETPEIYNKWGTHFSRGRQPDARIPRLPVSMLNAEALVHDIGPTESARLETPSGELIGLVIRNFCKSDAAVAWAGAAAGAQLPDRRNIRVSYFQAFPLSLSLMLAHMRLRWRTQGSWFSSAGRQASGASRHSTGSITSPHRASQTPISLH